MIKERIQLVSVGLPVYNEDKFIAKTIESLLKQDYKNIEIIITDNNSNDNTKEICLEYAKKDSRISYFRNHSNIGSLRNFNLSFELSKGEYFMWAGGHDLWDPSFTSRCVEILNSELGVALCYSSGFLIDYEDNIITLMRDSLDTRNLMLEDRLLSILKMKTGIAFCGMMRSDAVDKIMPFKFSDIAGGDLLFLFELSILGAFVFIDEPLFYMRKVRDEKSQEETVSRVLEIINPNRNRNKPVYETHMLDFYWYYLKILDRLEIKGERRNSLVSDILVCLKTKYGGSSLRECESVAGNILEIFSGKKNLDLHSLIEVHRALHYMNISSLFHPESDIMWEAHDLLTKITNLSHKIPPPKVSVIIPTYNRPELLSKALNSIISQTYKDIEIIVVNDGGEDVEKIITSLNRDGNIKYLKHDTQKGISAARNAGIKASSGKYIAYLDDDDIYYPDHIETLVNKIENSEYKVAYTDACSVSQEYENGSYVNKKKEISNSFDFDPELMLIKNYIPTLCLMHERSCLDETGLFDESLTTHEDWDLWLRMSRRFKFAHIKKVTCEYSRRRDGTSITYQNRKDYVESQAIIHHRYSRYVTDKPWLITAQDKQRELMSAEINIDLRVTPITINTKPHTIDKLVSVIIPIREGGARLKSLLNKIRSQRKVQNIEIIILDSGTARDSAEIAKEFGARLLSDNQNISANSSLYKIGVQQSNGEFVIFMREGAIPLNDYFIYNMICPFFETPDLAILSSKQFMKSDADLFSFWRNETLIKSYDLERDYILHSSLNDDGIEQNTFNIIAKRRLEFFNDVISCFRRSSINSMECDLPAVSYDKELAVNLLKKGKAVGYLNTTGVYYWQERGIVDILKQYYLDTKKSGKVILYFYFGNKIEFKRLLSDIAETCELINVSFNDLKNIAEDPVISTRSFLKNIQRCIDSPEIINKTIKDGVIFYDNELTQFMSKIKQSKDLYEEPAYIFEKNLLLSDFMRQIKELSEYLSKSQISLKGREKEFISCINEIFAIVAGEALGIYYLESESLNRITPEIKRIDEILSGNVSYS